MIEEEEGKGKEGGLLLIDFIDNKGYYLNSLICFFIKIYGQ